MVIKHSKRIQKAFLRFLYYRDFQYYSWDLTYDDLLIEYVKYEAWN